jgi:hypothetical protein
MTGGDGRNEERNANPAWVFHGSCFGPMMIQTPAALQQEKPPARQGDAAAGPPSAIPLTPPSPCEHTWIAARSGPGR